MSNERLDALAALATRERVTPGNGGETVGTTEMASPKSMTLVTTSENSVVPTGLEATSTGGMLSSPPLAMATSQPPSSAFASTQLLLETLQQAQQQKIQQTLLLSMIQQATTGPNAGMNLTQPNYHQHLALLAALQPALSTGYTTNSNAPPGSLAPPPTPAYQSPEQQQQQMLRGCATSSTANPPLNPLALYLSQLQQQQSQQQQSMSVIPGNHHRQMSTGSSSNASFGHLMEVHHGGPRHAAFHPSSAMVSSDPSAHSTGLAPASAHPSSPRITVGQSPRTLAPTHIAQQPHHHHNRGVGTMGKSEDLGSSDDDDDDEPYTTDGRKKMKRAANRRSAQLSRKRKKQFIEELKDENDDLRRKEQILRSIPDLIVVFDSGGKLAFVSQSVSTILQRSASELEGASFWECLCDDSVRLLKAAFMDALAARLPDADQAPLGSGLWDLRLVTKDGTHRAVSLNGMVHFAGDRPECVCSIRPRGNYPGEEADSGEALSTFEVKEIHRHPNKTRDCRSSVVSVGSAPRHHHHHHREDTRSVISSGRGDSDVEFAMATTDETKCRREERARCDPSGASSFGENESAASSDELTGNSL